MSSSGRHERAIADYEQSIILDPNNAAVHYDRGLSYSRNRDYDRAIADYSRAIELDSKYARAYIRGYARFYKGEFATAAADLQRLIELQPDDPYVPYVMLFVFLACARSGEDATSELKTNVGLLKTQKWPYAVIELYLGARSPDATLAVVAMPNEQCDAQFYIGQWHLLRSNRPEASMALQTAADICPKRSAEYSGAIAELERLKP